MLDLVIRGGQVVSPAGVGSWDIGIEGERIVALAAAGTLPVESARVLDATGKLVIPGGIDPHVHTGWPIPALGGGVMLSAGPGQVSAAALYGGTTTLVDFAIWEPGTSLAQAIAKKQEVWREGYTDHAVHVMLQGAVPPDVIAQIPETIGAGFPSFKIFTTDVRPQGKGRMIRLGHLWAIMEASSRHGGILAIHAEDDDLVMYMYERLEREGRTDIAHMPLVHSIMSEDISSRRVLRLARYVEGAAVYLVHVSSKAGTDAVAEARADHLHRRGLEAGDVARAVRGRHLDERREDPRALPEEGRHRRRQRRRRRRLRPVGAEDAPGGRPPWLRLQRLGRLGGPRLAGAGAAAGQG